MRILLDTAGYSALKRGNEVVREVLEQASFIGLTAVVLAELLTGFRGGTREGQNRRALREFMESPGVELLPMGLETAERYAFTHHHLRERGALIPTNDLWIAASALEHGLRLLTTDTTHFQRVPGLLVEHVTV